MLKTTPLESLHKQFNAEFTEYYGYSMPGSYSQLLKELDGLRQRSAAFDLCAFTRLSVSGKDAGKLISTAMPEADMPLEKKWSWGTQDKKTRILNISGDYLLLIHPQISENILERINKIASRLKVNLTDKTDKTAMIGIYGPDSFATLKKIVPMDIDELEPGTVMNVSFFMMTFTVVRGSWLGSDGVELICPVSASKFAAQAIDKYQRQESIVPAGTVCFEAAFEQYVSQQF
jgi:aminomethyltransferase